MVELHHLIDLTTTPVDFWVTGTARVDFPHQPHLKIDMLPLRQL